MRDEQTVKIELLSQWKLEAEFRNKTVVNTCASWASISLASCSKVRTWKSDWIILGLSIPSNQAYLSFVADQLKVL